jgi:hypothetical protein
MKITQLVLIYFTLILSSFSVAQISYEFKEPVPPNAEKVNVINSIYFGKYKNEETGTIFQFDENGITMISIINSYVTKEQVRESSKYQVRNNLIFGVVKDDSIPCFYENGNYYFGIKQKTIINDNANKAVLNKISDKSYMINFKESLGYSPSIIVFNGKTLTLKHFSYPSDTDIFNFINSKQTIPSKDYVIEILNPTQQEWMKINQNIMFDVGREFKKMK